MSCTTHVLGLEWTHHHWVRRVTATSSHNAAETTMWGRPVFGEFVDCHIQYVCRDCGETRDGGECGCDRERGEACPARLALLEKEPGSVSRSA